jgi:hypothetical protein
MMLGKMGNNLLEKFGGLENVWENVWGKMLLENDV